MSTLHELLEPEAVTVKPAESAELVFLASIAVSLKRIADAAQSQTLRFYRITEDRFTVPTQNELDVLVGYVAELARVDTALASAIYKKLKADGTIK